MEQTTSSWQPYNAELYPDALVQFELIDVDAAQVADVQASIPPAAFSSLVQVHDEITQNSVKIATLEKDYWKLDGTFTLPSKNESNGECGYWSEELSDNNGYFSKNPTLTFNFLTPQSSDGFTIVFDNKAIEVCSEFAITTFDALGNVINSSSIRDNQQTIYIVDCPSRYYSKVVLTITKTANPNRRARVCEVVFGYLQQFDKNKIESLRIDYACGEYMKSLPSNKMSVTIDNSDRAYNVLNPSGIYAFLQQGQGLNVSLILGEESINMGRFYFASASANDDALTATITAYDLLYTLDESSYNKGTTGTWKVSEALKAVIDDSGIDLTINIPKNIGDRLIGKCIPQNTSHREALRLIAQAAMSFFYVNRLGELTAKDFSWINTVDNLNKDNMTSWGKATDIGLINKVVLIANDEYASSERTYTACNQISGDPLKVLEINNPLALSDDVAEWILNFVSHRNKYTITALANPAIDCGDCISIDNLYGERDKAIVTMQSMIFKGSMINNLTAFGGEI